MHLVKTGFTVSTIFFVTLFLVSQATYAKHVVGWVEKVSIHPGNLDVKAKIDSGARTSSLHCDCIQIKEKEGEKWVSFTVTNFKGEQVRLERKIQRMSKIKRHFGELQERIVIKLGVCLGNVYKDIEVNVVDRTGLNYPMLIGRNFLSGDF
ncbi:MAG: RimK/LysX family protein, partial [Thioalkalispiraceae bacterium]